MLFRNYVGRSEQQVHSLDIELVRVQYSEYRILCLLHLDDFSSVWLTEVLMPILEGLTVKHVSRGKFYEVPF